MKIEKKEFVLHLIFNPKDLEIFNRLISAGKNKLSDHHDVEETPTDKLANDLLNAFI